ncbi:Hint domain-containing protein [Ruegeria sp. A3M17]|uniref:Hint domain-containing protein n=1 Tax=Ruegeria sp. A3M17 TaxID=2267229 RepID=UPI000DEB19CE|nr:Hint domain-containing protein [Ruegeria sp. A3M17]RBW58742.1 calcium-binding protein [Ruegeria sp. A3M17]
MSNISMVSATVDGADIGFSGSGTAGLDIWTLDDLNFNDYDGIVTVVVDFDSTFGATGESFEIVSPGNTADFGGGLSVDPDTGVYTFTFDASEPTFGDSVTFVVAGEGDEDSVVINFICFASKTLIETPSGPRSVESLVVGDMVMTKEHGAKPIRWIGSRVLSHQDLKENQHLRPVRFRAGALGEEQPSKDLTVSPQHRMYLSSPDTQLLFGLDQALAPAKGLVDGGAIDISDDQSVTYYHIMFDQHEVVLSNGAWSESFFPGDTGHNALDYAAQEELYELFPELGEIEGSWTTTMPALSVNETKSLVALKRRV